MVKSRFRLRCSVIRCMGALDITETRHEEEGWGLGLVGQAVERWAQVRSTRRRP